MPQLQKPLQGLARFLGLQSQGSLSVNWTPDLVPTLELGDVISPPIYQQNGFNIAQNGTQMFFTVPAGELWKVGFIGVFITTPAGVLTDSYVRLLRSGFTQGMVLGPAGFPRVNLTSFMHGDNAAAPESGYMVPGAGIWLFPGDSIGLRLQRGTGAGNNVCRMQIGYQVGAG